VLGLGLEVRPTFVGFLVGSGMYQGTFGLTFGSPDNDGGFYLDLVMVLTKKGVFGVDIHTGNPAYAVSAGWDIRFVPWLSLKLGAGYGHNPSWTDGKPHAVTFDASLGPVF
jgi:hypothetical protein